MPALFSPFFRAIDANGVPVPGAQMDVYERGTTTRAAIYSDISLAVRSVNPLIANSAGEFMTPQVATGEYRVVIRDNDGVVLYEADGVASNEVSVPRWEYFDGDGSQKTFNLSYVKDARDGLVQVFVGNNFVSPLNYSLTEGTITFDTAPTSGTDNIAVLQLTLFREPTESTAEAGVIFVSKDGNDANDGRTRAKAVASIAQALTLAQAEGSGTLLIRVGPGVYKEDGELSVPDNCAVIGESRSTTYIEPTSGNTEKHVFLMGSGSYISDFTARGWVIDDFDDPSGGFFAAFRPGAVITRAPYIFNVVMYRPAPMPLVTAPHDPDNGNPLVGNGGGVIYADGSVLSDYSPIRNFMAWGATPSCPNGVGYMANNRAHVNVVNAIALWCHRGFVAMNGGNVVASACATQFGDFSFYADGASTVISPVETTAGLVTDATAADALDGNRQPIIDAVWSALVTNGDMTAWNGGDGPTDTDEEYTKRDTGLMVDAISYCLRSGTDAPMRQYAMGFFDHAGASNIDADKLAGFQAGWDYARDEMIALADVDATADTMITNLVASLQTTIATPTTQTQPSEIVANGHIWTFPGSGVTRWALPKSQGGSGNRKSIGETIFRANGAKIFYSGQDDIGNVVFASGKLSINSLTGEITGSAFEQAVLRIATQAINARL